MFGGLPALTVHKIQAYNESEVISKDEKLKKYLKSFFIRFLISNNSFLVRLKKFAISYYIRSIEDQYIHQPFYKKLKEMDQKKSKKVDMSLLNKIEKDSKKNQDVENDKKEYSDENFSFTDISLNNIDQFHPLPNKKENKEFINYQY